MEIPLPLLTDAGGVVAMLVLIGPEAVALAVDETVPTAFGAPVRPQSAELVNRSVLRGCQIRKREILVAHLIRLSVFQGVAANLAQPLSLRLMMSMPSD